MQNFYRPSKATSAWNILLVPDICPAVDTSCRSLAIRAGHLYMIYYWDLKTCRSLWLAENEFCRSHMKSCRTVTDDRRLFHVLRISVSADQHRKSVMKSSGQYLKNCYYEQCLQCWHEKYRTGSAKWTSSSELSIFIGESHVIYILILTNFITRDKDFFKGNFIG